MSTSVSSVTSHFPSAENGFTTTLASTISSGAATVPLNSVAGYANGEVVVFIVDPSDLSKKQSFTGTVDTSGVQITGVVWTSGTNQTHTAGATVVDYVDAAHISMVSKGLLVGHNQDGTHKTSLPLTTPQITTSINDSNGNEVIKTPATASAVNEITVTNAATGNAPVVSATGGDTNIDLKLAPKGTGVLQLQGYNGWSPGSGTWTYASSTTFTVPSADATMMSVGTKIWLTQTTSKYFNVTGVSGTTITVTGGSDYTLANAAITSPYFSNAATPTGFPQVFNWTPTFNNLTVGSATLIGRFSMNGKRVSAEVYIALNSSTIGAGPQIIFPVTANAAFATAMKPVGLVTYEDFGSDVWSGVVLQASTTAANLQYYANGNSSDTFVHPKQTNSTTPFTFGNNDTISVVLDYFAA